MVSFLWFLKVIYHDLVCHSINRLLPKNVSISRAACGDPLVLSKENAQHRDQNTEPNLGRDRGQDERGTFGAD